MTETLQQGLSRLAPLPAPQLTSRFGTAVSTCKACGRRLTVLVRDSRRTVVPCDCGGAEISEARVEPGTWEHLMQRSRDQFGHEAARLYPLACARPFEHAQPVVRTRSGEAVLIGVLDDGRGEFLILKDLEAYHNRRAMAADAAARDAIKSPRPVHYRADQILPPLTPPSAEMVRWYKPYGEVKC